jgi:hypothetical protein
MNFQDEKIELSSGIFPTKCEWNRETSQMSVGCSDGHIRFYLMGNHLKKIHIITF